MLAYDKGGLATEGVWSLGQRFTQIRMAGIGAKETEFFGPTKGWQNPVSHLGSSRGYNRYIREYQGIGSAKEKRARTARFPYKRPGA
jgi:hypothetical protein